MLYPMGRFSGSSPPRHAPFAKAVTEVGSPRMANGISVSTPTRALTCDGRSGRMLPRKSSEASSSPTGLGGTIAARRNVWGLRRGVLSSKRTDCVKTRTWKCIPAGADTSLTVQLQHLRGSPQRVSYFIPDPLAVPYRGGRYDAPTERLRSRSPQRTLRFRPFRATVDTLVRGHLREFHGSGWTSATYSRASAA